MIQESVPKEGTTGAIIVGSAIIVFFLAGWVYKYVYVARDGYRYTIAEVIKKCSAPKSGEGYRMSYKVNNRVLETGCVPYRIEIELGTIFLLEYALADPSSVAILDYVLKDSIQVPIDGWDKPPYELFEKLP